MIQYTLKAGSTSVILPISIYDSSSAVGAKLAGLAYNTCGTIYYNRTGAAGAATQISPLTATKGTWTTAGFVAIDGTNMPGDYELHLPNAAIAAGATSVLIQIKGATNAVPVNILIELTAFDMQVATQKVDVDTIKTQALTCAAPVTVLVSVGTAATSTAQTGDSFAVVKSGGTGDNAAIKTKTDYLPSATAGAATGLAIVGSVMGKSPATLAPADVSGNLPVDVKAITVGVDFNAAMKTSLNAATPASVTGAVGSVTAAVSVTGDLSATMKTSVTAAVPSATDNADALLKRDWSSVTGEAARSVLNALRFLRNKWSLSTNTLTVTKEDDTTTAWTGTTSTDASALPIVSNDPS